MSFGRILLVLRKVILGVKLLKSLLKSVAGLSQLLVVLYVVLQLSTGRIRARQNALV